jgi:hypothetical protein
MQVATALNTRRAARDDCKSCGIGGQFTRSRRTLRWWASRFAAVQPEFEPGSVPQAHSALQRRGVGRMPHGVPIRHAKSAKCFVDVTPLITLSRVP